MDVMRQACSVLLVFSLLGALAWALRRGGRGQIFGAGLARKRVQGNTRAMVAIERLALTPQHTLHLVRLNGREVLVATHPRGCSIIAPAEPAERSLGARA